MYFFLHILHWNISFLFYNFTCKKRTEQTPTFWVVRLLFRRDLKNHYCLFVCFSSIIFLLSSHTAGTHITPIKIFSIPKKYIWSNETMKYNDNGVVMSPRVWRGSTGGSRTVGYPVSISRLGLCRLSPLPLTMIISLPAPLSSATAPQISRIL